MGSGLDDFHLDACVLGELRKEFLICGVMALGVETDFLGLCEGAK